MTADKQMKIPTHYTHERLGTMIGANTEAVTRAMQTSENTTSRNCLENPKHDPTALP
jgi:hypothetical protein